jgi:hypothetical protein
MAAMLALEREGRVEALEAGVKDRTASLTQLAQSWQKLEQPA